MISAFPPAFASPLLTAAWLCRAAASAPTAARVRVTAQPSPALAACRGLRRFLGLLLLERPPAGDILVVLFERRGEDVAAGAVGDEIEIVGLGRIGDRFERGTAGIGDRPRRQAVDDVGVVGRRLVDVGLVDRAVGRPALAAEHAVEDGRVGLQPHALVQPVDEDGGDARALVGHAGLLLDDRGERHELVDVGERQAGDAAVPDAFDKALLVGQHLVDDLLARGAARETLRVGDQAALRRHLGRHVAGQRLVLGDALESLLDGQPFRDGQRGEHRLAALQQLHDVAHGSAGLDLVFAGLQHAALVIGAHAEPEDARIADQAAPLELVGDLGDTGIRPHHEVGRGRRRAGAVEFALADIERHAGGEHGEHRRGHDEIHEDDESGCARRASASAAACRVPGATPRSRSSERSAAAEGPAGRIRHCLPGSRSCRLNSCLPGRLSPESMAGSLSPNMAKLSAGGRAQPL